MKISICIGSSCHLKGSRQIVECLQGLITKHNLKDKVDLSGVFCMGNCTNGVSLSVDGIMFSIKPEGTEEFFEKEILNKLKVEAVS